MTDYCKFADVFYGNGEVDHFAEEGMASKWFYIKALCGNTTPHAVLPFGKISVGAYSGGYPTGYGNHFPNSCGGIYKTDSVHKIRGFSHLHQSGTGAIGFYYNYAIVSPFYGDIANINDFYENTNEQAKPGYYSTEFNDILCEVTVNENTAYHRYTFKNKGGRVAVDFSNNGLLKRFGERFSSVPGESMIKTDGNGKIFCESVLSGIKLYFCARVQGAACRLFENCTETDEKELGVSDAGKSFGGVWDFEGDRVVVKLSYSTISFEKAEENIKNATADFDAAARHAYDIWNEHLSRIEIEAEDETKEKFYSNLYHSLIKPCDMSGEKLLGIENELVTDFATLWDQYKTALPLIFAVYPNMAEKIVKALINTSETLGRIPCALVLADKFPCEEQAKMLGVMTLLKAYHCGIEGADKKAVEECLKRELALEVNKSFTENGTMERATHILDMADACACMAEITDDEGLKKQLNALAENWKNAYAEDGLLTEDSVYYEGDRTTYSFRLHKFMQERIELAGGKERFVRLLDDFFGFGKESLKQITHLGADEDINATDYRRFQGFNNECDMEAPYAYIYAGRHDRLCDIIHGCITQSYTTGKGGLPGNNDSGGLSACFVWNALGLFPVPGTGEFLLGSPYIKKARVKLSSGNTLEIEATGNGYYVEKATFNGITVKDFTVCARDIMQGGKLEFTMK